MGWFDFDTNTKFADNIATMGVVTNPVDFDISGDVAYFSVLGSCAPGEANQNYIMRKSPIHGGVAFSHNDITNTDQWVFGQ